MRLGSDAVTDLGLQDYIATQNCFATGRGPPPDFEFEFDIIFRIFDISHESFKPITPYTHRML